VLAKIRSRTARKLTESSVGATLPMLPGLNGDVFAKILEADDDGSVLRFTAMPPGVRSWLRARAGGPA
jgi:hypothetical protein